MSLQEREPYYEMARRDKHRYMNDKQNFVREKSAKCIAFLEETLRDDPEVAWAKFVTKNRMKTINFSRGLLTLDELTEIPMDRKLTRYIVKDI